jgi:lysozyme
MNIFEQLERDEGSRSHPYTDTAGKTTIGVGRNLDAKGLTGEEISHLLENDIRELESELRARLPWFEALDDARQGVIKNMAFNMGITGLERFPRMMQAVAQGDWNTAADEMKDSLWAKEVGDRAVRLEQQMRSGMWV